MAEYSGSIDLISGIRPKNNGTFPLVDAKDIQVDDDGTRLNAALAAAQYVLEKIQEDIKNIKPGDVNAYDVLMDENGTTLDVFAQQAARALANLATAVDSVTPITMTEAEYTAAVAAGTIDENKTYYVIGDADE